MGPKPPVGSCALSTYAPMIHTALCIIFLMRATSISWESGRGLGSENLDLFGTQMVLPYRLDAISQGPKSVPLCKLQFPVDF